jgi:hypothetical protein
MIKKLAKSVWDILIEVGKAKQARYNRTGYSMWY